VDGVDPGPMTTTAAAELLDGLVVGNEVPRGAVEMVSLGVAP
jgi:hypothetical protein